MRPIVWGIILFVIGIVSWLVSVIFSVLTLGAFKILANLFGILFVVSIPVAVIVELVQWIQRKRK